MEILTDSKSRNPVLLPNLTLMEMLENDVRDNKIRLEKGKKLRRNNSRHNNDKNKFEHRDWIQEHVLEYLKSTPCVNIAPASKLEELKSKVEGYGVTEAESIQILNLMPTEPVEIHLMVEDLHARMSETKQEELLNMIQSYNSTTTLTNSSSTNDDTTQQKTHDVVEDSIESLEKMHDSELVDAMIKQEI
ncbi:MAG: DNA-directed RNA polymerase subunit F [Bacillariaceae sp.]|jgi:DNA-directed RNA polymerase subunit F